MVDVDDVEDVVVEAALVELVVVDDFGASVLDWLWGCVADFTAEGFGEDPHEVSAKEAETASVTTFVILLIMSLLFFWMFFTCFRKVDLFT